MVRLRLTALAAEGDVPVGPSFARMLIEDESAPKHDQLRAWLSAREEDGEEVDTHEAILRVELRSQEGGVAELEIELAVAGVLEHLDVGATWRTTAYDELGDGRSGAEGRRRWTKPAPIVRPRRADSAIAVVENADGVLTVDVWTLGELPAPDPSVWARLLCNAGIRALDPAIVRRDASPFIASVSVQAVGGGRDPEGKGRIRLKDDLSLSHRGTLHGRYRIVANDRAWLTAEEANVHVRLVPGRTWLAAWFPEEVLTPAPAASGPGDVHEFRELVELATLEDLGTQLEIVASGLCETEGVALAALSLAAEQGSAALPLHDAIARVIGSIDPRVAVAAIEASSRVDPAGFATMFAWAAQRTDPEVAQVARRFL